MHVSNRAGSSSGRQLYKQYDMFYIYRCEQSIGEERLEHTVLPTRLLTPMHVKHTILHTQQSLPEHEPTRFETRSRQQKLNINL